MESIEQDTQSPEKDETTSTTTTKRDNFRCMWNNTTLYLIIVGFSFISLVIYLCCSFSSLKNSQNKIINAHNAHIERVDYIVQHFNKSSSLFLNELRIDTLHKTSAGDQKALMQELRNDSILLHSERILLEGQTKNMVELHLSKVEHEYSNITIWAAILTIIFLVFSFYSMFKIEEAKNNAKEILSETTEKADTTIASIQSKRQSIDEAIKNISTQTQSITDEYKLQIEALINQYNEKLKGLKEVDKAMEEILNTSKQNAEKAISSIHDKTLSTNTDISNFLVQTQSITNESSFRMETLINQYKEKLDRLHELENKAEEIVNSMLKEKGKINE